MAVLTVTTIGRAGVDLGATGVAAAGGGDSFVNDGSQLAYFFNGSGGIITITEVLGVGGQVDGITPTARTFTVPVTTGQVIVGPFPPSLYNDANGRMNFTYSGVTSLKVAILKPGT